MRIASISSSASATWRRPTRNTRAGSVDSSPIRSRDWKTTASSSTSSPRRRGRSRCSAMSPTSPRALTEGQAMTAEERRLREAHARTAHWRRWGPYLSERQWGTVREDYSSSGTAWDYFPHDHARSRAYRWGEDGLLGISDNHQRVCFALALWNEN